MRRLHACALLTCAIVGHPVSASGQSGENGLSAYATLTSDYPHRGLSQTDEAGALQIGVDYQHRSGFFVGAWMSNVEFETEALRREPREIELDLYVGYSWLDRNWSIAATLAHYSYPSTSVGYDYTELSGTVGFRERFFYTVSYADRLLSHDNSGLGHEVGIEWPLPWGLRFAASVGRLLSDEVPGGDYDHWNAGVSKPLGRFGVDLRYYDTDHREPGPLGAPLHESWVVSLSYRL